MVYLVRPYHFKFFKDCLPQILFGPFLNILTRIYVSEVWPTNYELFLYILMGSV